MIISKITLACLMALFYSILCQNSSIKSKQPLQDELISAKNQDKTCKQRLINKNDQFITFICLKNDSTVFLQLVNRQNFDIHLLTISEEYINKDAILLALYKNTTTLFSIMKNEFQNFQIKVNGQISLKVNVYERTTEILFATQRSTANPSSLLLSKLQILFAQNKLIRNQLEKTVIKLQQQVQKKQNITKQFSVQISNLNSKNQKLQEKMKNELQHIKDKIEIPFHNNLNFQIVVANDKLRIWKKETTGYYPYIHPFTLRPGKLGKIQFKQIKSSRFLYYGLSTQTIVGTRSPFKNPQCLSYFAYDGTIYANNRQLLGAPPIYDGSIITVVADLIFYKIKWLANQRQLAVLDIPNIMRGKQLYFSIIMLMKDDLIQIDDR